MEFDKASPACSSPASQLVLYPLSSNTYQSLISPRESLFYGFKLLDVPPAHRAEGLLGQLSGGAVTLPSSEEARGVCTSFTCGTLASLFFAMQVKQNKLSLNCIPPGQRLLSTISPIQGEMFMWHFNILLFPLIHRSRIYVFYMEAVSCWELAL